MMMTINEAELTKLLPADPAQAALEAAKAAKKTLVDQLISNTKTSWKEEHRESLMACNDDQLRTLLPAEDKKEAAAIFADSKAFLAAIPDPKIRRVIEQGVATNERQKAKLVAALIANKGCKFTKDELEGMDVDFLEKVADSMAVTYVGQAPPRFNDRARAGVDANEDSVPDPPRFLTAPVTAPAKVEGK